MLNPDDFQPKKVTMVQLKIIFYGMQKEGSMT
jgi:hypothetical protein